MKTQEAFPPPLIFKRHIRNSGDEISVMCFFRRGRPTDISIHVFGPSGEPEPACHLPARVLNPLMTVLGALADVLDWSDISDESWGNRPDACGWLQERCELGNGGDGDLDP